MILMLKMYGSLSDNILHTTVKQLVDVAFSWTDVLMRIVQCDVTAE